MAQSKNGSGTHCSPTGTLQLYGLMFSNITTEYSVHTNQGSVSFYFSVSQDCGVCGEPCSDIQNYGMPYRKLFSSFYFNFYLMCFAHNTLTHLCIFSKVSPLLISKKESLMWLAQFVVLCLVQLLNSHLLLLHLLKFQISKTFPKYM